MKRTILAVLLLTGCSMNHSVLPATSTRPAVVTMSGYTYAGCVENLRREAVRRDWDIRENDDRFDWGGMFAEVVLFPAVKGVSCSAMILKGDVPKEF